MNGAVLLLDATDDLKDLIAQNRLSKSSLTQTLIVFGSLLMVTVAIFIWVVYFRKKKRHPPHHWNLRDEKAGVSAGTAPAAREKGNRKERRRRRRRPRNPTLAETRGLPPVRDRQPNRPPPY